MKRKWIAIILAAVLVTTLMPVAQAASAEPVETAVSVEPAEAAASETPVQGTEAALILSGDPENAGQAHRIRPETPPCEHVKSFPFTENVVLKGIFENYSYYFKTTPYWNTRYAFAQLEYTVSPLVHDVPASLTFFVNDTPVDSFAIDYRDGASQICFVTIPVELLKPGYNVFSITGFVRLYDEEGCLDDFAGANWVNISKNSFIEIGYDLIPTNHALSFYPYPLISSMDEYGEKLSVFVPEDASCEELRAAFLLRADLGNETVDEDRIAFLSLERWAERTANAVVIAATDRLPPDVRAALDREKLTAEGGALVFEYGTEDGSTLVLTAENDADLIEGACMLMDDERVTQEKRHYARVPSGTSAQVIENHSLNALIENGETIKGITDQDGLQFIGPFHQEATVYLPFSGGFVLGEGGKIDLKFRYSKNLDFERSLITVYWGSTPVASKKLEPDHADGDTFSFLMPSDVVGTHATGIKIAFDLEVEDLYCTKRADQMPWAYVSGTSTLFLPTGNSSYYDFSLRPYPFQKLGLFNQLAVVVPSRMTEAELALFGRLAALMGANVSPYGSLTVSKDTEFRADEKNCHIITLGTAQDNQLIRELNGNLSFPYNGQQDAFASNAQLLLNDSYAREIAVMQIIPSPWHEKRAVMVASAANDEALQNIDLFTCVAENTWKLAGDAFVIDSDLETKSFRFQPETQEREVTLRQQLEQHRDAVLFTLISTSAMLLLLLASILILLRYLRHRREEEKN